MESNFPRQEEKILKYWQENKIFEKSIKQRQKAPNFVFYEGPPTANGKPGIHHVLARNFKDIICRYKTMRGFKVSRKAGWDTHGLPVELEVEKNLGLKNKKDIEKYGIAEFNRACKQSVWKYKEDWEKLTERIGFWVDMANPYTTYEPEYMETLWWIIKQFHEKNLLYQDYKVVPYCPRCGTSLSSHEVALGYKKVKDPAIYVKFKIQNPKFVNSYLLIWTTTPWTLPANVAVAVNPEFTYAKVKIGEEYLILAKARMNVLGIEGEIVEEIKGSALVGSDYEPPYKFEKPDKKAWHVVAADFVSIEDGTGLVHIAPAFGEEDMQVGKQNNLPVILNVDKEGKFQKEVKNWAGLRVKDADPAIIQDLSQRGLLFKEESYEHDYPFCWRCGNALLYYAKESWFVRMQKVKEDLLKNNQKISWVPSHLKDGRFGGWLKEVKDWAFSRERYWGTPLPIWRCQKCGHTRAIGSLKELASENPQKNKFFVVRHGESCRQKNGKAICWPEKIRCPLTASGKKEAKKTAFELKQEGINVIYSSDLLRAKQTAEIIAKELGLKIIFDKRLREYNVGIFNGKEPTLSWRYLRENTPDIIYSKLPGGESLADLSGRVHDFLKDMENRHKDQKILMVSHELPLSLMEGLARGDSIGPILERRRKFPEKKIATGKWREIGFKKLPRNDKMEIDLHRPYIDEIGLICRQCGGLMKRVPDLVDVWFDSGSMPLAQQHYPFENSGELRQFPADYISEAVDQTRGWFYTLLAVSTLLGFGPPYKNVISLGHVLDEKGEKMSKSKGNIVEPWYIIGKYGADAVRWHFYTVNQPGEAKLFSERDVEQSLKKFIMTFWNTNIFYQTYAAGKNSKAEKNILDKWIISRLNELIQEATERLDKYDVTTAARAIEYFVINDLSLWYIRRSRKRFTEAAPTLALVLQTVAKLTAPFIPFLSEEIYMALPQAGRSVHLQDWPKANQKLINKKLSQAMKSVRDLVTLALAARADAGIKVRQPLAALQVQETIDRALAELIKEEVNVKKIVLGSVFKLDTKITPELKEEGAVREVMRQIQEMRKNAGYKAKDKIRVQYSGSPRLTDILAKNKNGILKEIKAEDFVLRQKLKDIFDIEKEIAIEQDNLWLGIKKHK
ncbi:MAG: isoleucine--tRNA ligase [Candidatus Nealsonbacteria bacterium]|nr:isoleucine--tRNA ligase [Candidatus Nealsonbacteria bacterium]